MFLTRLMAFIFLVISFCPVGVVSAKAVLKCGSTTSTRNSGLLDYLLPMFTKETGIEVQIIAVGTGAALALGKRGDVDCVLVHARDLELKLVAEGWFVDRHDLMYNDFVILGPKKDPAGIGKVAQASLAFQKIMANKATFISRGDNSGTNMREISIWKTTGGLPTPEMSWYLTVGQGMAKTIRIAAEKQAYSISDRGTWLALQDRNALDLAILFEGDPVLHNQYGIMSVNPQKYPQTNYEGSNIFSKWLISKDGQEAIAHYKDKSGNILFVPNADL